jgi:hypothetical protein
MPASTTERTIGPTRAGRAAATVAATAAGTGGGFLLATHLPLIAGLATAMSLAMFLGVVLPAVWSTIPTRRAAALTVLREILATLRGQTPSATTPDRQSSARMVPVPASQIRTARSAPPVASQVPSATIATAHTSRVWPVSSIRMVPVPASQIRTVPSARWQQQRDPATRRR